MIRLCLTRDPADFPDCHDGAHAVTRSVPAGTPVIRVDGVPQGRYGAAVIHDENGNARLDTMMGIPREGFGFSRDPAIHFGPPRFDATAFDIGSDPGRQSIRMRYLL